MQQMEALLRSALFSGEYLKQEFSASELVDACEKIRAKKSKQRRSEFKIVSAITSYSGIEFSKFISSDVHLEFDVPENLWSSHIEQAKKHFPDAYQVSTKYRRVPYIATFKAATGIEGFERARYEIDVWRGAVNLASNIVKHGRRSFGTDEVPLNNFVNSKFSSVIDSHGEFVRSGLFFYTQWRPPRNHSLRKEARERLQTDIERYVELISRRHALSEFSRSMLVKYVRATDTPNWLYSFTELWSVLEQICCIQSGQDHKKIVERVSTLYEDKAHTKLMLDHLRVRRNNIIHKGYEEKSDTSERILFQLNRYVTQALWLIVSNGLEFSSKDEWVEFLDTTGSVEALRAKKIMLDKAIKFRRQDP